MSRSFFEREAKSPIFAKGWTLINYGDAAAECGMTIKTCDPKNSCKTIKENSYQLNPTIMHSDTDNNELRNRLVQHLKGGNAFTPIDTLIEKMPFYKLGTVPDGLPYSFYQLFYHIWYGQHDILQYCLNDDYQAPDWPDDYWPGKTTPDNEHEWQQLVSRYFNDREALSDIIQDVSNNLFRPFPQNPNHNLFREIQLVIEHTAYHVGQLFVIYRLLK